MQTAQNPFTTELIADLKNGLEVFDGHRFITLHSIRTQFMETEPAQTLFTKYRASHTEKEREEQNNEFEQQLDAYVCNVIAPQVMAAELNEGVRYA